MPEFRLHEVLVSAGAFFLGALVAFFGMGPVLFADGHTGEKMVAAAIAAALYLIVGVALGASSPAVWKSSGLLLAFPAAPIALAYCESAALACVIVVSSSVAASLLGVWLGRSARMRYSAASA